MRYDKMKNRYIVYSHAVYARMIVAYSQILLRRFRKLGIECLTTMSLMRVLILF